MPRASSLIQRGFIPFLIAEHDLCHETILDQITEKNIVWKTFAHSDKPLGLILRIKKKSKGNIWKKLGVMFSELLIFFRDF